MAAAQNKNFDATASVKSELLAGYGLYLANDPFSTAHIGIHLVVVPIKANNEFAVFKKNDFSLVRSDAWGLLYTYPAFLARKSERIDVAAVVRNEGLIDWQNVSIITSPSAHKECCVPPNREQELLGKSHLPSAV